LNIFFALFIFFGTKFCIFIFQKRKYISMMTIRYDHSDNFISLYHVSYLINGDRNWRLNIFVLIFILLYTKFYIFIFQDIFINELQIYGQKCYLPKEKQRHNQILLSTTICIFNFDRVFSYSKQMQKCLMYILS